MYYINKISYKYNIVNDNNILENNMSQIFSMKR